MITTIKLAIEKRKLEKAKKVNVEKMAEELVLAIVQQGYTSHRVLAAHIAGQVNVETLPNIVIDLANAAFRRSEATSRYRLTLNGKTVTLVKRG